MSDVHDSHLHDQANRPEPGRNPANDESRDRYRELLEELRTIMPGAQVLLGFLLTVPFASRFEGVDRTGKIVLVIALVAAAAAAVMFLSPSAYHRVAEDADRGRRIQFGVRAEVTGLVLTAVAVSSSLFVVIDFLFGRLQGLLVAGGIGVLAVLLWFVRPLIDRRRAAAGSGARTDGRSAAGRSR